MKAVGVKRYKEMEKLVGSPSWEHFMSKDGDVMKLDQIKAETGQDRAERVEQVRALIQDQRRLTREVATFGFVK